MALPKKILSGNMAKMVVDISDVLSSMNNLYKRYRNNTEINEKNIEMILPIKS